MNRHERGARADSVPGMSRIPCAPAVVTLAIVAFTGCGPSDPLPVPLRVGISSWPGYEFLYLAQERQYFAAEGLNIKLVEYASLGDTRRGLELGQLDGMACTMVEVLQTAHHARMAPHIVMITDYSDGADVILARPSIRGVADLRGVRVAVEGLSVNGFVVARALDLAGLRSADVAIVRGHQAEIPELYRRGAVDAAVTYPPYSALVAEQGAKVIFTSRSIPGEVIDVVAFSPDAIETRGREIEAMIRAFDRAVADARERPDDAYAVMAKREGISVGEFREALTGVRVLDPAARDAAMRDSLGGIVRRSEAALREQGELSDAIMADVVARQPWRTPEPRTADAR